MATWCKRMKSHFFSFYMRFKFCEGNCLIWQTLPYKQYIANCLFPIDNKIFLIFFTIKLDISLHFNIIFEANDSHWSFNFTFKIYQNFDRMHVTLDTAAENDFIQRSLGAKIFLYIKVKTELIIYIVSWKDITTL